MKPAFLIIFFLLYAFDFAAADLDPVYDPSHRKLQTGVEYYIHPFLGGSNGGGITVAATRNKTCPLDVAQDRSNFADGLGLTFHPVNIKKGMSGRVIRVSTDLVIKFSSVKGCARSGVWKVDKYDELRRRYFVTIGGAEGRGAGESFVCITAPCNPVCDNVGAYYEHGRTLLALTEEPLVVLFQEVFKG
uniref:Uncharacterized protein n=1 Tax=Daucus carota subsp. sativus TaxID=79200 RepID=A0A161WVD9_DAUCS